MSPDWVACPYGAASFLMKTDATKLSLALDWLKSSNNERSTKTLLHILHTPTATDPNVNCGESLNLTLKGYQELLRTSLSLHVKLSVCLHFINLSCQVMSAWILVQVRVGGACTDKVMLVNFLFCLCSFGFRKQTHEFWS